MSPRAQSLLRGALVAASLAAFFGPEGLPAVVHHLPGEPIDLRQDYFGAVELLAGRSPYGPGFRAASGLEVNGHPPTAFLWFMPVAGAGTSLEYAGRVWTTLNLLCVGLFVAVLVRASRTRQPWLVAGALAAYVTSAFFFGYLLWVGQVSLVVALLLALSWAAAKQERWAVAGALVAVAATFKLFPLAFGLLFLCWRRWSALVSLAVIFGLAALTPCLMTGTNLWSEYAREESAKVLPRWVPNEHNASLNGLYHHISEALSGAAQPAASPLVSLLGSVTVLALTALLAFALVRAPRTNDMLDDAFVAVSALSVIASPLAWEHYYFVLVGPLIVASLRSSRLADGARYASFIGLVLVAHGMAVDEDLRTATSQAVRAGTEPLGARVCYDVLLVIPSLVLYGMGTAFLLSWGSRLRHEPQG